MLFFFVWWQLRRLWLVICLLPSANPCLPKVRRHWSKGQHSLILTSLQSLAQRLGVSFAWNLEAIYLEGIKIGGRQYFDGKYAYSYTLLAVLRIQFAEPLTQTREMLIINPLRSTEKNNSARKARISNLK